MQGLSVWLSVVVYVVCVIAAANAQYGPFDPNTEACWKNSATRGVGSMPDSCLDDQDKDGDLCYPRCNSGYHGVGPVCWGECPWGYTVCIFNNEKETRRRNKKQKRGKEKEKRVNMQKRDILISLFFYVCRIWVHCVNHL